MKHAIIGAGNLGLDLRAEIIRQTDGGVEVLTRSRDFDVEEVGALEDVAAADFDYIWYCVGYGSVQEAMIYPNKAHYIHVTAPEILATKKSPETKLMVFSSDYAADEDSPYATHWSRSPRSVYAKMKIDMEKLVMRLAKPNVTVMRVGSLYGYHKPQTTFPGKVLERFAFSEIPLRFPSNYVTPTSSLWAAATIIGNLGRVFDGSGPMLHHCAPDGNVPVVDWARLVLKGLRDGREFDEEMFLDLARPTMSRLGCTFAKHGWHWTDVWNAYFRRRWFTSKSHLDRLPASDGCSGRIEAPAS